MSSIPTTIGLQTAVMSDAQVQLREFARALRSARTLRQMSVDTASRECLLSDKQILGLETADLRPFYSAAYARRGAERYARFLGVGPVPPIHIGKYNAGSPGSAAPLAQQNGPSSKHWTARLKHLIGLLKQLRRHCLHHDR